MAYREANPEKGAAPVRQTESPGQMPKMQARQGRTIVMPAERHGKPRFARAVHTMVDIALAAAFIALMSTAMVREVAHEYLGMAAFALFVAHQFVNRRWWAGLVRGRWNARRFVSTLVDVALSLCIVGQAASALVLSKYALGFLPALDGAWWARIVHLLCSYWGLALLGAHVGMHLSGIGHKLARRSAALAWAWRVIGFALAACGTWAFVDLNVASYLFLQAKFAFVDPSAPLWLSVAKYSLIAALFAVVGCIADTALRQGAQRQPRR